MKKHVVFFLLSTLVCTGLSAADVWQKIADKTWVSFDHNDFGRQLVFVKDTEGRKKAICQQYGSGCYVVANSIYDVSLKGDSIIFSGENKNYNSLYFNDEDSTLMEMPGIRYKKSKLVIYNWLGNYCQGETVNLEVAKAMLSAKNVYQRIKVSDDIELVRLSDNVYLHVSVSEMPSFGRVSSNGLILIDKDSAFLFNTAANDSLTALLVSWMETQMGLKVVGFVPNHWHQDCMGGLRYLQGRHVKSYANQRTIKLAKKHHLPLPDVGFNKSLKLQLGETAIECYYPGPAHSMDNIVVWIPSERILFAGCMVKSLSSTNLGNLADGDERLYPKTLKQVSIRFPSATYVIPGHGDFGGRELIQHTRKLCDETRGKQYRQVD